MFVDHARGSLTQWIKSCFLTEVLVALKILVYGGMLGQESLPLHMLSPLTFLISLSYLSSFLRKEVEGQMMDQDSTWDYK